MSDRRPNFIAVTSAVVVAAAALTGLAPGASATTRFAAPSSGLNTVGTAPCTNSSKPCALVTALGEAVANDDVQLADGDYFKASKDSSPGAPKLPFSDPLNVPSKVVLHGTNPADLPVIHVDLDASGETGVYVNELGTIRDVAIKGTAASNLAVSGSLLLDTNALGERVRVETSAAAGTLQRACTIFDGALLRDAVCLGRGTAAGGSVEALTGSCVPSPISIRNVTAITTVASSPALNLVVGSSFCTATISNSIFRGTGADVSLRAAQGGGMTANLDHTNWVTQTAIGPANVVSLAGNQNGETAAVPKFVDAASGDVRQAPGSPTIDAGVVSEAKNGPLALGGTARALGVSTDIGAFEFDPQAAPPTTPEPTTPVPTTPEPTTPQPTSPTGDPAPGGTPGSGTTLSTPTVDLLAPQLTGLKVGRSVKRSKGTAIQFSLSEAATVVITFAQPKAGRTVGGKCRKVTAKNRKQPQCTIPNVKGTLTVDGRAGANTVSFKGKVASGKRLGLGSYSLEATPTDAAGNRGAVATRKFTLKR